MERMNDLQTLLKHDVQMLRSVEQQIIAGLPAMIAKAENPLLKQALEQHLEVTRHQLERINSVREILGASEDSVENYTGLMSRLMGGGDKAKGLEGLLKESTKILAESMNPEVMDAAIIGGYQKIEHYEMACYGTARTFARQLGLNKVADLLQQTLDEERETDEQLTKLAVSVVNIGAQHA